MRNTLPLILAATLACSPLAAMAGNGSDIVVGSVLGGAVGAVIGNGFGGRDGAIIGGAIGAAAGVTIATDDQRNNERYNDYDRRYRSVDNNRYGYDYDHDEYDEDDDFRRGSRAVIVESPRHYYSGNDFVYGVPPRDNYGYQRGRGHHGHHQHDRYCGHDVIVVQQSPRYEYENRYYSSRRW